MLGNSNTLNIIKASIWNTNPPEATWEDYEEMKLHAIVALPADILSSMNLSVDLYNKWHSIILQSVTYNINSRYVQSNLPITVPYVILKGTSAAQYYPHPEYRIMGDIDIMTKREDYDVAYKQLIDNGFKITKQLERETSFVKNGIGVELHRHFASLNNPDQAKYLDDLICEHINSKHVLPDILNGLVILEHIDQHLENGLGLRQVIDWMMFVHKCLPDDNWEEFKKMANNIGLIKLAVTVTRLCELYMGLPSRQWCSEANDDICIQLMEYIVSCGNFGIKRIDDSNITENIFVQARTLKAAFKLLQERGIANWPHARNHRFFRSFAWLYQLVRYVNKGLRRGKASKKLKAEIKAAKKRDKMFEMLEVARASKGIIIYQNGKYKKI